MKLATGHPFDDDHRTAANRTAHLGRDLSMSFAVVCTKQSPAPCEHTATPAVGKKAEVADADQTLRQNVDQESAQKLIYGDCHDLLLAEAVGEMFESNVAPQYSGVSRETGACAAGRVA